MRAFKIGFWVLLTIGIIVVCFMFAMQNNDPMTLTIFDHTTEVQPKWKILLLAGVCGAVLSTIFFIIELLVLESKNIRLRRANRRLMRALEQKPKGNENSLTLIDETDKPQNLSPEPSFRIKDDDDV